MRVSPRIHFWCITALVMWIFVPSPGQGQTREATSTTTTRTSSVLMVRSSGEPAGMRQPTATRPVPSLTYDQIKTLVQPLGFSIGIGTEAIKLTTATLEGGGGNALLSFDKASVVAKWGAILNPASSVNLMISPLSAGQKFFIDCAVSSYMATGEFRITAPNATMTFPDTNHLTAVYVAPDTSPALFRITGTHSGWEFHSCTVSRLS